jgi:hypothetical protein
MKRVLWLAFACCSAVWLSSADLAAWGDHGHGIVARVAARKLTAQTKRRMVAIIRNAPDDELHLKALVGSAGAPQPTAAKFAAALALMATWPDHMPGGKGATAPWHFVNIGLFEGPDTTADRCQHDCITELIPTLIGNITASKPIRVTETSGQIRDFGVDQELRFLVHFLGDIHQPLHVTTNADAGGNCERLTGFTGSTELHAAWDTALVLAIEKSTPEATVTALLAEFGSDVVAGGVVDPRLMVAESFLSAKNSIYPKTKPAPIPVIDHFVDVTPSQCATEAPAAIRAAVIDGPESFSNAATKRIVRQRLYDAGVRLATILNSLFLH